jgi:hypothetical protein
MREHWLPDRVKEWDDAIEEYIAIEEASKQHDRPSAKEWNTSIPELLASSFTRKDLAKVHACLRAVAPIEAQGMTLITRIELAALRLFRTVTPAAMKSARGPMDQKYSPWRKSSL